MKKILIPILLLLFVIEANSSKMWHIAPGGKAVGADTTVPWAVFNGIGGSGDTCMLDTIGSAGAWRGYKYIVPWGVKAIAPQHGNMCLISRNGLDTIAATPNGTGNDIIYLLGTTSSGFYANGVWFWRLDSSAAPTGNQYILNTACNYMTFINCGFYNARGYQAYGSNFVRDMSLNNIGSKTTPTHWIFRGCMFDSASCIVSSYDSKYGASAIITKALAYRCDLGAGFHGKLDTFWIYQNASQKGSGQIGLWASYDTIGTGFVLSDSCVTERISASSSGFADTGCVIYNTIVWRNNHEAVMFDTQHVSQIYGCVLTDLGGSPLYNHCNGNTDSCIISHNVFKTFGQAAADLTFSGGTKHVNYNTFTHDVFWVANTASQGLYFSSGSLGDTVKSSAMGSTDFLFPIANGTFGTDTIHIDTIQSFSSRTILFYPVKKSTNKLIFLTQSNPSLDSIMGPYRWLHNRSDTTGTINVTSKGFSIVDSIDWRCRVGDYQFSWANHWFTGDTIMTYLQDSIAGSSTWMNADSAKILAGKKYSFRDSTARIAGKNVHYRVWGRFLATAYTARLGMTTFADTDFFVDSVIVPASGPSVTSIVSDSGSVAGGQKVAINGSNLTGTTVKIGSTGYASATSQTMTSVSASVDTITTTAFARGLYKVYVTDGSGNVDSSKTIYFAKATLIYTPTSYTESQGTISPGYTATDSAAGNPRDSVGFKTALPAGLGLNHTTGAITGTPTGYQAAATYWFYAYLYGYKNDSASITITVTAYTPTITSITPDTAPANGGKKICIVGTHFFASQGAGWVSFYGTPASSYPFWSDTKDTVIPPAMGHGLYALHIYNDGGVASAGTTFYFSRPGRLTPLRSPMIDTIGVVAIVDSFAWQWDPPDSMSSFGAQPTGIYLNHAAPHPGRLYGTAGAGTAGTYTSTYYGWLGGIPMDSVSFTITVVDTVHTSVSSIIPAHGLAGAVIAINGGNLSTPTVTINGETCVVNSNTSTVDTVITPSDLTRTSYLVHVCTSKGCDSSKTFRVINLASKPVITSPANGATGISVSPTVIWRIKLTGGDPVTYYDTAYTVQISADTFKTTVYSAIVTDTQAAATPALTHNKKYQARTQAMNPDTSGTWSDTIYFTTATVQYTLTMAAAHGTTSPSAGTHTLDSNTTQSISHTPPSGWGFKNWTVSGGLVLGGAATVNANSVIISAAGTATANDTAIPIYSTITVSNGIAAGTVTPSGANSVQCLASLSIGATANPGRRFDHWVGSANLSIASPTSASTTCATLDSNNATCTATWDSVRYAATIALTGPGVLDVSSFTADSGTLYTVSAHPPMPWDSLAHWTQTGGSHLTSTAACTTTCFWTAAGTITATFACRAATAPTASLPAASDTGISTACTFSWVLPSVDSAAILEGDTSAGFVSAKHWIDTIAGQSEIKQLDTARIYHWRLWGLNNGGKSTASAARTFTTRHTASGSGSLPVGGGLAIGVCLILGGYVYYKMKNQRG